MSTEYHVQITSYHIQGKSLELCRNARVNRNSASTSAHAPSSTDLRPVDQAVHVPAQRLLQYLALIGPAELELS